MAADVVKLAKKLYHRATRTLRYGKDDALGYVLLVSRHVGAGKSVTEADKIAQEEIGPPARFERPLLQHEKPHRAERRFLQRHDL